MVGIHHDYSQIQRTHLIMTTLLWFNTSWSATSVNSLIIVKLHIYLFIGYHDVLFSLCFGNFVS